MCSACTDEYEANNGGMKECCEGVPFTVRAIVADFEELSNAGKSSTRTLILKSSPMQESPLHVPL